MSPCLCVCVYECVLVPGLVMVALRSKAKSYILVPSQADHNVTRKRYQIIKGLETGLICCTQLPSNINLFLLIS